MSRRPAKLPALRESAARATGKLAVDRDAGVIKGVKVLGWDSGNGRRYEPAGVDPGLYEGVDVNVNHPKKPGESYPVEGGFGRLVNCRKEPDGIYADLHFLKTHPLAERVCEAAERMPGAYGLSHNVPAGRYDTDPRDRNRIVKVHQVHSVDLVRDPATTSGLFEEDQPVKTIPARDFFKGLESRLDLGKRARVKALREDMGDDVGDVPMPEEPAEPEGDYKADLLAAVAKLLDSTDEESQGLVGKIMGLLKPAKPKEPVAEDESDDKEGDEKKDKKDDVAESLQRLQRKDACRDLCESLQFIPSKDQLDALLEIGSDKARKTTAESFAAAGKKPAGPRSRLPGGLTESRNGAAPIVDAKSFTGRVLS